MNPLLYHLSYAAMTQRIVAWDRPLTTVPPAMPAAAADTVGRRSGAASGRAERKAHCPMTLLIVNMGSSSARQMPPIMTPISMIMAGSM